MSPTSIEWAEDVWNPTVGCTRVSPGCDHCYAFQLHDQRYAAKRRGAELPAQYDKPFSEVQLFPDRLDKPIRRRKPTRYFVDSMADLFHEDVPDDFIHRVFAVMALAQQHTFLVLTKRPARMHAFLTEGEMSNDAIEWSLENLGIDHLDAEHREKLLNWTMTGGPAPNVWLGVSAEDQQRADERIPILLDTPAAVRFVSAEPLLGPIDFAKYVAWSDPDLHWIIVGGESGKHARPLIVDYARSIVEQCRAAGVAVFVKQLGSNPQEWAYPHNDRSRVPMGGRLLKLRDRKGGKPEEWPEDLRVREFPQ